MVIAFIADERRVDVINFGHEGPLVLGPRGVRRLPQEENPPLGLAELTGAGPAGISRVLLEPGETVLLVTDGVTEARDRHGHFFPLTPWAQKYWATGSSWGETPSTLLDRLMQALVDTGDLPRRPERLPIRKSGRGRRQGSGPGVSHCVVRQAWHSVP